MFIPKNTDQQISAARTQASDAQGKIEVLERRIEKLKLYSAALTAILVQKLGVTEAEISDMINTLDLADGKVDGTLASPSAKCATCGKVLNARLERCMYCGNLDTTRPFLETV